MLRGALHRLLVVTFAAAILYGGGYALASEAVTAPAAQPPPLGKPLPLAPGPATSAPAAPDTSRSDKPQAEAEPKVAHIALLLPLESAAFARHADAVKN